MQLIQTGTYFFGENAKVFTLCRDIIYRDKFDYIRSDCRLYGKEHNMSTVSAMANQNSYKYPSSVGTGTTDSVQAEITALEKKADSISSDNTLSASEKSAQLTEIRNSLSEKSKSLASLQMAQIDESTSSSPLLSSLSSDKTDATDTGLSFFFGSSSSMQNVIALNKARIGIENEARSLLSEINVDKIRGVSVTDKQEKLTNLTQSLSILDDNLNTQINTALKEEETTEEQLSVIDRIKKSLEKKEPEQADETAKTTETNTAETSAAE